MNAVNFVQDDVKDKVMVLVDEAKRPQSPKKNVSFGVRFKLIAHVFRIHGRARWRRASSTRIQQPLDRCAAASRARIWPKCCASPNSVHRFYPKSLNPHPLSNQRLRVANY
jgi:hypothetical protein